MRVVPCEESKTLDLHGHTLIVPGCGGQCQLGELAVDALVSTYSLSRVAIVESRHVLPVAMVSAFESKQSQDTDKPVLLTTAAELYQGAAMPRVSVLQLRSAVVEGYRKSLAREILGWARDAGVSTVLILASCSSHVRRDADLRASTELRFVSSVGKPDSLASSISTDPDLLPLGHSVSELEGSPQSVAVARQMLRSSGLARSLLIQSEEMEPAQSGAAGSLSVHCILGFVHEILDWSMPEKLAKVVLRCLASSANEAPTLVPPPSWHLAQQSVMPSDPRLW
eukprot:TRINITY_DN102142_c0_g1_i1.p1 TRINITY_DN102142_c0_g1~~TRINITY_DN102142_c0_g1_i1.p1  ORF type:complete len:282 (+),score=52.27 TRINITY_DN102142_c0_g1_i1:53-898(+)